MNADSKSNIQFYGAIAVAALVCLFLHFWRFGEVPNGFYIDESAIGYNAWCIADTGKDEFGVSYPMFFRCFDNYHDPVMVYFLAPFVKVFGLSRMLIRGGSAFFSVAASVAFAFLVYHYTKRRYLGLIGAVVFSLLPWTFPDSRIILSGYNAMLLGIIIGWLFLVKAVSNRSYPWAVLAASGWSLAMYAHNCGRPTTAVTLVLFVLCYNLALLRRWRYFLCFVVCYFLIMTPMIVTVLGSSTALTERFNTICVWQDSPSVLELTKRISTRYLEYFSPHFLLFVGGKGFRHGTGQSGVLYLSMVPFILLGLYGLIKRFKRSPKHRFALLALLIFPFAAVLTIDHYHSTRVINGVPYWCLICLYGVFIAWTYRKKLRIPLIIVSVFAVLEAGNYFRYYFSADYEVDARRAFYAPFTESLEFVFQERQEGDVVYLSAAAFPWRVNARFYPCWYSSVLFFGKVPPSEFIPTRTVPTKYAVPYLGRCPAPGILLRPDKIAVVETEYESDELPLQLNSEPIPTNAILIKTIPISKRRNYEIYRIPVAK